MLWLRTTGLGNLSKTEEKATAPQDQGTRGTELSLSHAVWPLTSQVTTTLQQEWKGATRSCPQATRETHQ